MKARAAFASFAALVVAALLPMAGCTSVLGQFHVGPQGDAEADSTTGEDGGDAQTMDVVVADSNQTKDAPSDVGADAVGCGPSTCAGGCCDATGHCILTASQSGMACGTGGLACSSCASGESCASGACSCGGMACAGCCNSAKQCVTTPSKMACGTSGAMCQMCTASQECTAGQCECDSTTCPTGCCTAKIGGSCVSATSETTSQCGSAGSVCAACTPPTNATATCTTSGCTYACNTNYSMCSGSCVDPVTDPANCGACGHSCFGGTCMSGTCQPFVLAQPPVTGTVLSLATDGTSVLWMDSGKGGAYQIPVAGGAVVALKSGISFGTPAAIAVAAGKYAFTQPTYPSSGPNVQLWTGSLGVMNGAVPTTTMFPTGTAYGVSLTSDAANIGLVETLGNGTQVEVQTAAFSGAGPSVIDTVTCTSTGCPPRAGQQTAANGRYFAWTINVFSSVNGGEVGLYDFMTHTKTYPLTNTLYPDFPVMDANNLYWADNADLQIYAMTLPSGTPTLIMQNGSNSYTGLAVDSTNAYYTLNNPTPGSVNAVNLNGMLAPVPIYTGGSPQGIVAGGGGLFWIDSSSNKIYGLRYP